MQFINIKGIKMGSYTGKDKRLAYLFNNGGGGGTTVVANPAGAATDILNKLQVGQIIYNIPSGGGGSIITYHADWTAPSSNVAQKKLTDEITLPAGKYMAFARIPYATSGLNYNFLFALLFNGAYSRQTLAYTSNTYGFYATYFELTESTDVCFGTAMGASVGWDANDIPYCGLNIVKIA